MINSEITRATARGHLDSQFWNRLVKCSCRHNKLNPWTYESIVCTLSLDMLSELFLPIVLRYFHRDCFALSGLAMTISLNPQNPCLREPCGFVVKFYQNGFLGFFEKKNINPYIRFGI